MPMLTVPHRLKNTSSPGDLLNYNRRSRTTLAYADHLLRVASGCLTIKRLGDHLLCGSSNYALQITQKKKGILKHCFKMNSWQFDFRLKKKVNILSVTKNMRGENNLNNCWEPQDWQQKDLSAGGKNSGAVCCRRFRRLMLATYSGKLT